MTLFSPRWGVHRTLLMIVALGLVCITAHDASAINFGKPIPADQFPTVGMVKVYTPDLKGYSYGTGTLIAPDIVLTAAHVVASAATPRHIEFQLPGDKAPLAYGCVYRFNPEYFNDSGRYSPGLDLLGPRPERNWGIASKDIALVKLDRDLPINQGFYRLAETDPEKDSKATLIGYGIDESKMRSPTGRMAGELTYHKIHKGCALYVVAKGDKQQSDHGDSGGPLMFKRGEAYEIAAIVQGSPAPWQKIDGYASDEWGSYVSISQHRGWLKGTLEGLTKYPRPVVNSTVTYLIRADSKGTHLAMSLSQIEAMANVGIEPNRFLDKIVVRGVSEPLPEVFLNVLRKVGVPKELFASTNIGAN